MAFTYFSFLKAEGLSTPVMRMKINQVLVFPEITHYFYRLYLRMMKPTWLTQYIGKPEITQ